ncbi:hypothetical protein B0H19DRAFT_1246493 [Mycena capillaripes]|nr:hypothetical protein B0H19DRAFT_1246493 [Mycena capillaripes]
MPPKPLLMSGSKTAPSFDGKATHLDRYFRDVIDVGDETEWTSDVKLIWIAQRYLDIDDKQLWSRKVKNNMTYTEFKKGCRPFFLFAHYASSLRFPARPFFSPFASRILFSVLRQSSGSSPTSPVPSRMMVGPVPLILDLTILLPTGHWNIQRFDPATVTIVVLQSAVALTGGIVRDGPPVEFDRLFQAWVLSSQSRLPFLRVIDVLTPFRRHRGLVRLPFARVFSNPTSYPASWTWADVAHQTFTAVSVFRLWEATIFGIHKSPIVVFWNCHSCSWSWHDGLSMRDLRLELSDLTVKATVAICAWQQFQDDAGHCLDILIMLEQFLFWLGQNGASVAWSETYGNLMVELIKSVVPEGSSDTCAAALLRRRTSMHHFGFSSACHHPTTTLHVLPYDFPDPRPEPGPD